MKGADKINQVGTSLQWYQTVSQHAIITTVWNLLLYINQLELHACMHFTLSMTTMYKLVYSVVISVHVHLCMYMSCVTCAFIIYYYSQFVIINIDHALFMIIIVSYIPLLYCYTL